MIKWILQLNIHLKITQKILKKKSHYFSILKIILKMKKWIKNLMHNKIIQIEMPL